MSAPRPSYYRQCYAGPNGECLMRPAPPGTVDHDWSRKIWPEPPDDGHAVDERTVHVTPYPFWPFPIPANPYADVLGPPHPILMDVPGAEPLWVWVYPRQRLALKRAGRILAPAPRPLALA